MRTLLSIFVLIAQALTFVSVAQANDEGEALFNQNCSACHQPGGTGTPGLAPPLVNSSLWPSLGNKAENYFFGVINNGMSGTISVDGIGYYGLVMPTRHYLSADEMANIADYVLNDLNGLGVKVDHETLAQARATPLSHADLRAIRKNAQ